MTPDSPEVIPMIKSMGKGGNHTNVANGITPGRRWGIEIADVGLGTSETVTQFAPKCE